MSDGYGKRFGPPARSQRGDAVRAKVAELDAGKADVAAAVKWARKQG
jgi:hypothetical protein